MNEIPLKILIVDPGKSSARALVRELREVDSVLSVVHHTNLRQAEEVLREEDINSVYIDPLELGVDAAGEFIFNFREEIPHVVFVLYYSMEGRYEAAENLYGGERSRFRHYYKLNKSLTGVEFSREVRETVSLCQGDLRVNLAREKISSLQAELATIQKGTSAESALVPLRVLKEIQEQLAALKEGTKQSGLLNSPAAFLGLPAPSLKQSSCFVIMPYSQSWSKGVEIIVRKSCQEAGFEFQIAKAMDGRFIPQDIWQGLTGSGVIIADLTDGNANVAYEVGLADAIGREVVLICQNAAVPFDFLGQRLVLYENTVGGAIALQLDLIDRLNRLKAKFSDSSGGQE